MSKKAFLDKLASSYHLIDTIIGIFIGAIIVSFGFIYKELDWQTIKLLEPYIKPLLQLTVFIYCMKQAHQFVRPPYRTKPFIPTNTLDFVRGNFLSLAWIIGAFVIILGTAAVIQIVQAIK